ncbi:DUF4175 family protein [Acidisoma cellulosilytica]|uniref:DUF4175 family protein n=1 Tax=Acidisoma cellulosilyticum TaxID=2802395 RepID=A0A964E630_9PROT|nr:DUF4175 family protein [Acidisoma cellulosilyticum]MCB8883290.1 DUF4175 family protein [Acidisoma cellulosilyticum]
MADRDGRRDRLTRATHLPRRLIRWARVARAVLVFEAVWPVIWPPLGLWAVYLCVALLGLPQRLGIAVNSILVFVDVLAGLVALGIGIARIRWPDERDAQARLTRASGLKHDPIAALLDSPAQTDADSDLLWRAHRARVLASTRRLRVGMPWPWRTTPGRFAFRGGILAALILCLWLAGPMAQPRLTNAFTFNPLLLLGPPAPPPGITAWVTPPPYTGRPPVLLPAHADSVTLPKGSRLTVTVSGVTRAPQLDGLAARFHALDADSFQMESTLDQSGLFVLRGRGESLARWQIIIQPDVPPIIGFAGLPGPDSDGYSLRLPWHAVDDYAVVSAHMTAHLIGHLTAPGLSLTLAMPDGPAPKVDGVQVTDLSANPWAGLPVSMQLDAEDAAGQTGRSTAETVVLPERRFIDPYARRVIAIRKGLVQMTGLRDRDQRVAVVRSILDTAATASLAGKKASATLPLFGAGWQLLRDRQAQVPADIIDTLWQVALHFEQGDAADTAQSLNQAEKALQNALQGNGASAAELTKLMQQMQSAILQHLSTLMQMAQHQGGQIQVGSAGKPFDLGQLAQQLQAMQAAAKAGDINAMRQAMAQLQQSLAQLAQARIAQPDPKQMAARAQAEKDLGSLQQMMKTQAQLLDRSTSRAESGSPDPAGQQKDAAAQAALQRAAKAMAGRVGPGMTAAGQSMGQAAQQLGQGQDAPAGQAQSQALQALQQAANALGRQLSSQPGQGGGFEIGAGNGQGQGGEMPLDGFSSGNGLTDPLGRPLANGQGVSYGADIRLPDGLQQARLRAILQELRSKAGDLSLSPGELDYIERLLQPF